MTAQHTPVQNSEYQPFITRSGIWTLVVWGVCCSWPIKKNPIEQVSNCHSPVLPSDHLLLIIDFYLGIILIDSMWACGSTWQHRFELLWGRVIDSSLTALCHYLNQWWLISCQVFWYSPEGDFAGNSRDIDISYECENYWFKITVAVKNLSTSSINIIIVTSIVILFVCDLLICARYISSVI